MEYATVTGAPAARFFLSFSPMAPLRHSGSRSALSGFPVIAFRLFGSGLSACTQARPAVPDAMDIIWCDTVPLKQIGRKTQVPYARAVPGFGTVSGVVFQAETGDALQGAGVSLVARAGGAGRSQRERGTDPNGGFVFDSVIPAY